MEETGNICFFISHPTNTQTLHTVNFVYETTRQVFTSLRSEPLYRVIYVTEGHGILHREDGSTEDLLPGDLFFTHLRMPYALESDGDFRYMYISFVGDRAKQLLEDLHIQRNTPAFHHCEEIGKVWRDAIMMKTDMIDLTSESVLLYTLAALGARIPDRKKRGSVRNSIADRVRAFIDSNYSDPGLSLDLISSTLSYSRKYLSEKFRESMDMSIADYIQTVRIQNACSMMQNGAASVSVVSYSCGYRDSLYFSRVFRKKCGISPRDFLKQQTDDRNAQKLTIKQTKNERNQTMDRKLRIGVFGGARGKVMMNVLFDHPDAELVAVCDKYVPLLEEAKQKASEHGREVALFEHFEDFIEYDMDAVVLANYATEHAPYAIKAMKKGKHVLSEVLPCETMAQAVELIETVEQTGLVYAYAENYCYMQHTFEMWQKYKTGELGEVMYGEGEYIHDCGAVRPRLTYGERDHWRNRIYATYYCTHSLGPLLMITGKRPKSVVGFETVPAPWMLELGTYRGAAVEMVTLENGAVLKSVHGGLKREPGSVNFELYCTKGMMETGRMPEDQVFNLYKESDKLCVGSWEKYAPVSPIEAELAAKNATHGGSDFYPTHFFIEKILGRESGKWSIDVYQAVDMGICGILAYYSVLAGNQPMEIPDLRDPAQRDKYRNDNACTTPEVAGDQLLPRSSFGEPDIPDSVYDHVRELWLKGEDA